MRAIPDSDRRPDCGHCAIRLCRRDTIMTCKVITAALLALAIPFGASGSLGIFEHGNGIQSMAMGGVSYSVGYETTALGANPAHAIGLGNRWDVGVDVFYADAVSTIRGNSLGPDERYHSDAKSYYAIPQGGWSRTLSDRLAIGVTVLSAGLGPAYDGSPYERFGGSPRTSLQLSSSSVVTAAAFRLSPKHVIGASLNTGYQELKVTGLQFLANEQASLAPNRVTNQGKDGAFTAGLSIGWLSQLTPQLTFGAGYRSRNWTQRHKEYRGLIAEGGKLELPAIYGLGFAYKPAPAWTIALETQRYTYRKQRAFRNGIGQFAAGEKLGAEQGPGFGWDDQYAYKLGVSWQATPKLALRAGYIHATQIINSSETLFAALGCLTGTNQYTAGATWLHRDWELSLAVFEMPKKEVRGRNSIPPGDPSVGGFGGGEADISDLVRGVGFSVGRRF